MTPHSRAEREHWLRRAVLDGDESAWRTIYDESFAALLRFVRWKCGTRSDWVDEIVQETWLVAVRRLVDFDPQQGSLEQWLRGIAVNQLRNLARRHGQTTGRDHDLNDVADERGEASAWDEQPEIAATLASLSDRYAAVLRAKYLDGCSVAEIATSWNETPKSIESLLTRARQAFRDVYGRLTREPR
ncbi:MAG: sigma-70 family RNA polymerase sigma factor [Planctomycetaceae bacterium]|nr:sigma-70 family RNA polymerase sigma factor [Planctomycetaceae bacterium]